MKKILSKIFLLGLPFVISPLAILMLSVISLYPSVLVVKVKLLVGLYTIAEIILSLFSSSFSVSVPASVSDSGVVYKISLLSDGAGNSFVGAFVQPVIMFNERTTIIIMVSNCFIFFIKFAPNYFYFDFYVNRLFIGFAVISSTVSLIECC